MASINESQTVRLADSYIKYVPKLLRYARRLVRDEAIAEDSVQDGVIRVLGRFDIEQSESENFGLLLRAVRDASFDRLKRERRHRDRLKQSLDVRSARRQCRHDVESYLLDEENSKLLDLVSNNYTFITINYRYLFFGYTVSFVDIAKAFGISSKTAKKRHKKELNILRESI